MNLLKKVALGLALTAYGCMSLLASGTPACNAGANVPTLTVGMDLGAGLDPYGFVAASGDAQGFDVAVACQIALNAAITNVVIKNINYSALLPALLDGTVDLIISDYSITPNAASQASFVPYAADNLGVIFNGNGLPAVLPPNTNSGNILENLADLAVKPFAIVIAQETDTAIGTPTGRRELAILDAYQFPAANVLKRANLTAALTELRSRGGTAFIFTDLSVANRTVVTSATAAQPLFAFAAIPDPEFVDLPTWVNFATSSGLGIGVRNGCTQLLNNVKAIINSLVTVPPFSQTGTSLNELATENNVSPFTAAAPSSISDETIITVPVRNNISLFILNNLCECSVSIAS